MYFHQLAVHAAPDDGGIGRIDGAECIELQGCVSLPDCRNPDGNHSATLRRSPVFGDDPVNAPDDEQGGKNGYGNDEKAAGFLCKTKHVCTRRDF